MVAPSVTESTAWIGTGTEFFTARAATVRIEAGSSLPGWTNGHVLAHVARNAEAITRLLTWTRTGVETPMYASVEARNADIERGAGRPLPAQLADLRATAADLDAELAAVPDDAWSTAVRMVSGRTISGAEVPWLRVKEVWLHAVDIGAAVTELPPDLVTELLGDVVAGFDARADVPGLRLLDASSGTEFTVGTGDVDVRGDEAELLAWLTGRSAGARLHCAGGLPRLPNWA
ncbi:MAG TPA: maleylpyruvate isomerase family mycothiol-dependent enzyme [Jatrophihabitans sp.]|nr:maleylpyruvate isomerase family mycothiol-dependent enzyme [Jatrophihabitans sp.]